MRPSLKEYEFAFLDYIRDPEHKPLPSYANSTRMALYRRLVFNNINSYLTVAFPITSAQLGEQGWRQLVRDFISQYHAKSPLYRELPFEFMTFLRLQWQEKSDFTYLLELADYEQVEIALDYSTEKISWQGIDKDGDLLSGWPQPSPLAVLLVYHFPVHLITVDMKSISEISAQETYLLVYRDHHHDVNKMELNAVTARLWQLIINNDEGLSGRDLLLQCAEEMHYLQLEELIQYGLLLFKQMRERDVLLGVNC